MKYVDARESKLIDEALLEIGYSMEDLILLAGESVARAVLYQYPPSNFPRPLFIIGLF